MDLFREVGFQAATATEIAQRAGVSRGTFFNYYPYKEAVLLEYGGNLLKGLWEEVRLALKGGRDPLDLLREIFRRLAGWTREEKDLLLPLLYELLNPDPERARAAFQALPLGDMLAEVLAPLREAGRVRRGRGRGARPPLRPAPRHRKPPRGRGAVPPP